MSGGEVSHVDSFFVLVHCWRGWPVSLIAQHRFGIDEGECGIGGCLGGGRLADTAFGEQVVEALAVFVDERRPCFEPIYGFRLVEMFSPFAFAKQHLVVE